MNAFRVYLFGAAVVLGTTALAAKGQEPEPSSTDSTAQPAGQTTVEPTASQEPAGAFESAKQLESGGMFEAAAQKYAEAADKLEKPTQTQQAWLKSGACCLKASRLTEAVQSYEKVLSMSKTLTAPEYLNPDGRERKTGKVQGGRAKSANDRMQMALHGLALTYRQMGDTQAETRTINRLKAEYPNSPYILELLPPQAAAAEAAAAQVANQGHDLFWQSKHDRAMPLLDQVIDDYPETAAALRARGDKAAILWGRSQWAESRAVYEDIWSRVREVAPDSHLGRTAQYRIAWLDMGRLNHECLAKVTDGEDPPDADWQRVRDACLVVMSKSDDPAERAHANVTLIETYCYQQDHVRTLDAVKVYFRNYGKKSSKNPGLKRQEAEVRLYAGNAAHRLGDHASALTWYRSVVAMTTVSPELPGQAEILPYTYFRLWWALKDAGAPQSQIDAAGQDVVRLSPDSSYARAVLRSLAQQEQ